MSTDNRELLAPFDAWENGRVLRAGYTTGTCAAAAASAAVTALLTGDRPEEVRVKTPAGPELTLLPEEWKIGEDGKTASCAVRKDAGDDPDVTDGLLIAATAERVSFLPGPGETEVLIDGGTGVGRVTRPGLDQPVGAAAINRVPREMIRDGVREAFRSAGMHGTVRITISVPEGEKTAAGTFNPRLGITGGISVLGTEGIVRPMSRKALTDTIRTDVRVHAAAGRPVLAVPGNYGLHFLEDTFGVPDTDPVIMSNFIGETIDAACEYGAKGLVLAGHLGKFVKLAGGIMNTHSREADCRMELLTAHALRCGAKPELLLKILGAGVTQEATAFLREAGLLEPVCASLLKAMERAAEHRSGGRIPTAVIFYTMEDGILGMSENAEELLKAAAGPEKVFRDAAGKAAEEAAGEQKGGRK